MSPEPLNPFIALCLPCGPPIGMADVPLPLLFITHWQTRGNVVF